MFILIILQITDRYTNIMHICYGLYTYAKIKDLSTIVLRMGGTKVLTLYKSDIVFKIALYNLRTVFLSHTWLLLLPQCTRMCAYTHTGYLAISGEIWSHPKGDVLLSVVGRLQGCVTHLTTEYRTLQLSDNSLTQKCWWCWGWQILFKNNHQWF